MKILSRHTLPILMLLAAGGARAEGNFNSVNKAFKQHTFGAQLAVGSVEYKGNRDDDNGVSQLYTYYNYAFNPKLSLEVALNIGSSINDLECEELDNDDWHCFNVDNNFFEQDIEDISYQSMIIAAKGTLPLSTRNSLYAKIGAQFYNYKLESDVETIQKDDGAGLYFSAGWQYQWDFGLGMNVGYEASDMGDLETFTLHSGISYRF